MKRLGVFLLTLTLVFGLLPQTVTAAESSSTFEQDLTAYLQEVSTIRGFAVSKEDINASLSVYDMALDDFNTVADIKLMLGDVIKADLSNLDALLTEYNLTKETLTSILEQYGEELDDYIYVNDLDMALSLYVPGSTEQDANFETDLATYLSNVSSIRGFEVTKEHMNAYLSEYYMSTDDFKTVDQLSEFLGDVIKADLSNLDYYKTNYDMTQDDINEYLAENGKSIDDFVYVLELEDFILGSSDDLLSDIDTDALLDILSSIGITEDEIQNIEDYFMSMEDYLSSDEVQTELEDLVTRMSSFFDRLTEEIFTDENYEPSADDIAEAVSYYEEFLSIFKLSIHISIVNGDKETPLSLLEFATLDSLNGELKFEVFGESGQLLMDVYLTKEFLSSQLGIIIKEASVALDVDTNVKPVQTVKGGKLPKTATNYIPNALAGMIITFTGLFMFLKVRKNNDEVLQGQ